ncbi:hypothetical protein HKX48_001160 [Thoreauomyces humboldtii]|nr:hypothetical protein HKX48_001160 [Thoreauomyces humboldtii]
MTSRTHPTPYARFFLSNHLADALVVPEHGHSDEETIPFPIHRVILATQSAVLEGILAKEPLTADSGLAPSKPRVPHLSNDVPSSTLPIWQFPLPDCSSLRLILEWCYCAYLPDDALTTRNCWLLRSAGQQLQIDGLDTCIEAWLERTILKNEGRHLDENEWENLLGEALKAGTSDDVFKRMVDRAAGAAASSTSQESIGGEFAKYRFLRRLALREDLNLDAAEVKRAFAVAVDFTLFDIPQLIDAHSDTGLPRDIIADALMKRLVTKSTPSQEADPVQVTDFVPVVTASPHSSVFTPSLEESIAVASAAEAIAPSTVPGRPESPGSWKAVGLNEVADGSTASELPATQTLALSLLVPELPHLHDVSTYELADEFPPESQADVTTCTPADMVAEPSTFTDALLISYGWSAAPTVSTTSTVRAPSHRQSTELDGYFPAPLPIRPTSRLSASLVPERYPVIDGRTQSVNAAPTVVDDLLPAFQQDPLTALQEAQRRIQELIDERKTRTDGETQQQRKAARRDREERRSQTMSTRKVLKEVKKRLEDVAGDYPNETFGGSEDVMRQEGKDVRPNLNPTSAFLHPSMTVHRDPLPDTFSDDEEEVYEEDMTLTPSRLLNIPTQPVVQLDEPRRPSSSYELTSPPPPGAPRTDRPHPRPPPPDKDITLLTLQKPVRMDVTMDMLALASAAEEDHPSLSAQRGSRTVGPATGGTFRMLGFGAAGSVAATGGPGGRGKGRKRAGLLDLFKGA